MAANEQRLDRILRPKGVAVVGASGYNVGAQVVDSLQSLGYGGRIYPVHPREKRVLGLKVYPSLSSIGAAVDVAIVTVSPTATVEVVRECGRLGIPGAVCVAGGYRELGHEGRRLESHLVDSSREHGVQIIGPNTLGFINMDIRLNATFFPMPLERGVISMITQSGGVGFSFLMECIEEKVGVSKWIGVGNRSTLDFADYLFFLGRDPSTHVISIFMEATERAREFIQTAGNIAKEKPVVLLKVGRSELAQYSALTHTGSMAGSYKMYSDIFRQYGLLEAGSIVELACACKALAIAPVPRGPRLGLVTITSGPSIVAIDEVSRRGARIEPFPEETLGQLREVLGERPNVVLKNPLDTAGAGFEAENFGRIVDLVLQAANIDLLLVIYCYHRNWRLPTSELICAVQRHRKPVVACYLATRDAVSPDVSRLQEKGIPVFSTLDRAIFGVSSLINYSLARRRITSRGDHGNEQRDEARADFEESH